MPNATFGCAATRRATRRELAAFAPPARRVFGATDQERQSGLTQTLHPELRWVARANVTGRLSNVRRPGGGAVCSSRNRPFIRSTSMPSDAPL